MEKTYISVILSFVSITICKGGLLPSYITPCDLKDKDFSGCIKGQIENALPKFTKGIPELGVPSIDPVKLHNIYIDGNGLNMSFTKVSMHGLSNSKLTDMKVDIGKSEEKFSLKFKVDLNLTSQYEVDGKILILPIRGNGGSVIQAHGVEVAINCILSHVKKDDTDHLKLVDPSYEYTIDKTIFQFDNLFNGNKQLSDTTHQFANENWEQLMDELAPPVIKQIVAPCVKAINKFFLAVSIDEIIKNYQNTLS